MVTATGKGGLEFSAAGLPEGLTLDPGTGRLSGALHDKGEYLVTLKAKNSAGEAQRTLRIAVGDQIALTPPMGWNSWNCWGDAVSQEKVLRSAKALVAKGLVNHGWCYINIDDGWQGRRGGPFHAIQPNSKFSDMKSLGDAIHALGLRFGIYSSPWRGTYAGHIGSSCDNAEGAYDWVEAGKCNEFWKYNKAREHFGFGTIPFIEQDARQWAAWGVDYLKYDWAPIDAPHTEAMGKALAATGRDIVYSLSNNASFQGAADWARLSNCWRTTLDMFDNWKSMSGIGFNQDQWAPFAGPGHWPDPDMLVVGQVGWGPTLHPTGLTPNEQYTHISLWCLMSAPLLIGCDLEQLDEFTIGLLTNDEVLEIDQDPLGRHALCKVNQGDIRIYVKELEDGSRAVGLFNLGGKDATVAAKWADIGVSGNQRVRDLWRQKDMGTFEQQYEALVPSHGVVLVKIERENPHNP